MCMCACVIVCVCVCVCVSALCPLSPISDYYCQLHCFHEEHSLRTGPRNSTFEQCCHEIMYSQRVGREWMGACGAPTHMA